MEILNNVLAIVYRGLEVSTSLIGPWSLLIYLALIGVVYTAYFKRGGRFYSFVHLFCGVFFFFVIWNHPGYSWYKARPWNGGYVYALVMIVVYFYLPIKAAIFVTEVVRGIRGTHN